MTTNPRARAAQLLAPVLSQKGALKFVADDSADAPLIRELCYGSLRWYPRLNRLLTQLLQKPLKQKDADIQALLIIGLYQLFHMRTPDHAAIDQTVSATKALKKPWAKGLTNALLRNAVRQQDEINTSLQEDPVYTTAHPQWLIDEINTHWPSESEQIFLAGNTQPPMFIRVNTQKNSPSDYRQALESAAIAYDPADHHLPGLRIEPAVPVAKLPGFTEGLCSVQDRAAQWAAKILAPADTHRILDACAAPGGKTAHILEIAPSAAVTALEIEESRSTVLQENLSRLDHSAHIQCADACATDQWWDNTAFDRILIDAPCSGTGVIRRHPDIKLLRRQSDIAGFCDQQQALLHALWPTLARDGLLLYVTCSIMPAENEQQIQAFLERHTDAKSEPIDADIGMLVGAGRQSLPEKHGADGFYYCLIRKL